MPFDWKTTVYEFMSQNNALEVEGTIRRIAGIKDESYLHSQQRRLARLAEENKERQVKRVKNELHLKILETKQAGNDLVVLCKLRRKLHYIQKNQDLTEQRIERIQMKLRQDQGGWSIVHVKPLHNEAAPATVIYPPEAVSLPERRTSRPYLHPSIRLHELEKTHRFVYDREAACQYADLWWDYPNPEYIHFKVDCTNYVSQCLYAGGVPMDYTNSRESGWWYRGKNDQWSFSWSVAHSQYWTLSAPQSIFRAKQMEEPWQLKLGDCILYDWDGSGHYGHSVIVAAKDADGMPLVNAHTTNSKHRYWDYKDSYAWSEQTRYAFFNISF